MLWWMIVGHAVCDYPLQGDFLARGKNRYCPLPGVPAWICLLAHAVIHGGAVALVTGSVLCGALETLIHILIDDLKCRGLFGFTIDQAMHIACKLVWLLVVVLS